MIGNRVSIFPFISARFSSSRSEFDEELVELDEIVVEGVIVVAVVLVERPEDVETLTSVGLRDCGGIHEHGNLLHDLQD